MKTRSLKAHAARCDWRALARRAANAAVCAVFGALATGEAPAQSCVYSWTNVGGGASKSLGASQVSALAVYDDGSGEALYVGGSFDSVGSGVQSPNLAKWNGLEWTAIGANHGVTMLSVLDDGSGPRLYAGGLFSQIGGQNVAALARLEGGVWTAVGTPLFGTPLTNSPPSVRVARLYDDGSGQKLYIGGDFNIDQASPAYGLARLDNGAWTTFGGLLSILGGINSPIPVVGEIMPFESGGQTALIVGGNFESIGAVKARNVAAWNGASWSPLGAGLWLTSAITVPSVMELLPRVEGGKPVLYAVGRFSTAQSGTHGCIARWDGSAWETVGGGIALYPGFPPTFVTSIMESPLGDGSLIVGGSFEIIGGLPIRQMAFWDGKTWSPFGNPSSNYSSFDRVSCMLPHTLPSGPGLFVGGIIDLINGGTALKSLAQYKCITGDLNGDGKVAQEDLGILLGSYGVSAGGDLDGDKDTDQADLGILLATYEP